MQETAFFLASSRIISHLHYRKLSRIKKFVQEEKIRNAQEFEEGSLILWNLKFSTQNTIEKYE